MLHYPFRNYSHFYTVIWQSVSWPGVTCSLVIPWQVMQIKDLKWIPNVHFAFSSCLCEFSSCGPKRCQCKWRKGKDNYTTSRTIYLQLFCHHHIYSFKSLSGETSPIRDQICLTVSGVDILLQLAVESKLWDNPGTELSKLRWTCSSTHCRIQSSFLQKRALVATVTTHKNT